MKQPYPTPVAAFLKQILFSWLLCLFSVMAFGGNGASSGLSFRNPILESGVAGKDGAVYRFSSVALNVDALVRIKGRSDSLVYMPNIDLNTTGFDNAFQPVVGYNKGSTTGAVDWWMDFEISFVDLGTTTPVTVKAFDVSTIDVDGNGAQIHEYAALYGLSSYTLEKNSLINVSNITSGNGNGNNGNGNNGNGNGNGNNTVGKRFDGPTTNFAGIDTSATTVMATASYVKTNTFTVRFGGVSTAANGGAERMNSLYFKNFNYKVPQLVLLPVQMQSFTVTLEAHEPVLNWTAAEQSHLGHYTVERSSDGKEFSDVTVIFAGASASSPIDYSFTDRSATSTSPILYYRLKIADTDGRYTYSSVRLVKMNADGSGRLTISTFPNPVASELRITIPQGWQNKAVVYDLFNNDGHMMMHFVNSRAGQTETLQMNEMSPGTYFVKLTAGNESAVQEVVKF